MRSKVPSRYRCRASLKVIRGASSTKRAAHPHTSKVRLHSDIVNNILPNQASTIPGLPQKRLLLVSCCPCGERLKNIRRLTTILKGRAVLRCRPQRYGSAVSRASTYSYHLARPWDTERRDRHTLAIIIVTNSL